MPLRLRYSIGVFGSFTLLDVAIVAIGFFTFVSLIIRGGSLRRGDPAVGLLLAVPLFVCALSIMWSDDLNATFRQSGILAEAVLAYWLAINLFRNITADGVFRYMALFVMLLFLGSLLSLLQVHGFQPATNDLVEGSPEYLAFLAAYYARLGNPFYGLSNDFATVLALFIFPFLAWSGITKRPPYMVLSALSFAAVVLTQSRGALVATIVGGVVFLWTQRRRFTRWLPSFILGMVVTTSAGYIYYKLSEPVQTYLADRLAMTNIQDRMELLSAAFDRLSDAPVLGYGGGVLPGGDAQLADGVHNTYLQQMLYYGIPLGVFITLALSLVAVRFFRWPVRGPIGGTLASAVGVTVLVQLIAYLGETSFEATLPKTAFYLVVALCVIALQGVSLREDPARRMGYPR